MVAVVIELMEVVVNSQASGLLLFVRVSYNYDVRELYITPQPCICSKVDIIREACRHRHGRVQVTYSYLEMP